MFDYYCIIVIFRYDITIYNWMRSIKFDYDKIQHRIEEKIKETADKFMVWIIALIVIFFVIVIELFLLTKCWILWKFIKFLIYKPPPDLSTEIFFLSESFSCWASSISAIRANLEYATWPDLIADIICKNKMKKSHFSWLEDRYDWLANFWKYHYCD